MSPDVAIDVEEKSLSLATQTHTRSYILPPPPLFKGLVPVGAADLHNKAAPLGDKATTPGAQCLGGGGDGRFLVCGGADGKVLRATPYTCV